MVHPGVEVAGRYDFEEREIELSGDENIPVGTAVHEWAHFYLEIHASQSEPWLDYREQVGFALVRAYVSQETSEEFRDLYVFLERLLVEDEAGSQAYSGLLTDIPGIKRKLGEFRVLVETAERAGSERESQRLREEAFRYYQAEIHEQFDNPGLDRVWGLHEAYASLVQYVATQDFPIPEEIAEIVCPPLDCDELRGKGAYEFLSYEDYNESVAAAAMMAMAALTPVLSRLALLARDKLG